MCSALPLAAPEAPAAPGAPAARNLGAAAVAAAIVSVRTILSDLNPAARASGRGRFA
eukprot:CAMPEP_0181355906 /NCGR_PEP_ID=MMETSP1106-20121128/4146_1 /TAXON_ID=81844 /ORGANISM="Mantoniella antarctica, Strain SL-175" /LENGTH=56 /DNA_ID=CAMNT_0023468671 /DNA_START=94 /DNA_END=264 /DNA_ORIENTATION=+